MLTIQRTASANPLVNIEALAILLFEGEINAHQFQISPPERVSYAGHSVRANFIRSDQKEVPVNGWLDGQGRANVVLTKSCYAVPGNYRLFIYVEGDEKTVCVYACTGTVVPTVGKNGPAPETPNIPETYPEGALDALEERVTAVESGSAFMPALVQYSETEMVASYDYPAGVLIAVGMELYQTREAIATGDALSTSSNVYRTSLRRYLSGSGRATSTSAHAEGSSMATGNTSHAEGSALASGILSHAEGGQTTASGSRSHSEGSESTASGASSHAEGEGTEASGFSAHAEGWHTVAEGNNSHAEGEESTASGDASHAEGSAVANGGNSHAEGGSTADGVYSHAEGLNTTASGSASHSEGEGTIATHCAQHVFGAFNTPDPSSNTSGTGFRGNFVEIVGNGTSENARSDARTLDWAGNESLAGGLTLGLRSAMETFLSPLQLRAMMRHLSSGRCHVVRGTGNSGVLVPAPILSASGITFGGQDSPGGFGYFFVDDFGAILGGVAANAGLIPYSQDLTLPPMIFPRSGYLPYDIMFYWDVENQTIKYAYPPAYASSDLPENMYCFGYWRWNAATGRLYDCEFDIE